MYARGLFLFNLLLLTSVVVSSSCTVELLGTSERIHTFVDSYLTQSGEKVNQPSHVCP